MRYLNIKSIKKIGKKKTFDINVKDNENFYLTNGILSHNSGKTTSLLTFAQSYRDNPSKRYKIFDLWGGDRNEHLYWCLASNKLNYWQTAKKILRLNKPGPKQYKVNLLFPLIKNLRTKLPFNPPIFSKIFTIPFRDVTLQDISLIIGTPSLSAEGIWKDIISLTNKNSSIPDILDIINKKMNIENTTLYKNVIKPLTRNGLLEDDKCEFNLNINEEIRNKDVISVVCLDFVDKEYKLFVLGYILRKIAEVLDKKAQKTKNILILREASEFFRATDQAIVPERQKIFRSQLSQYIRMGRRGMHLLLDSQSPSETRGLVDGQQDLTLLGRLPSEADRREATDQLYRDNLITKKQIAAIASLEPGQFVICPSGKPAMFRYFLLPKTQFWEEGDGNFFNNIWRNRVDRWMNIDEEINKLKERREKNEEIVKERNNKKREESEIKQNILRKEKAEKDKIERALRLKEKLEEKRVEMEMTLQLREEMKEKRKEKKTPISIKKPQKVIEKETIINNEILEENNEEEENQDDKKQNNEEQEESNFFNNWDDVVI